MTKIDVYNADFAILNQCYNEIYDIYERLQGVEDFDPGVLNTLGKILLILNPTLDKIEDEMTIKPRYSKNSNDKRKKDDGSVIWYGNFTGE